MSKLKLNPDNTLNQDDLDTIQTLFERVDARAAKAKELEKSAKAYFNELDALANDLEQLSQFSGDVLNEDDEDLYFDECYPYSSLHSVGSFWIPSSMGC